MPIFTVNACAHGRCCFPVLFVGFARAAHAFALGDFGHGDVPPPAAGLGRTVGIGLDADDVGSRRGAGALERRFELGYRLDVLGQRAERSRMRGEIDARRAVGTLHAIVEQVVERLPAAGLLQPVDAAVAAIVEHDDDELHAQHHRGRDLGVEHQVAAVADDDDDLALGLAPS